MNNIWKNLGRKSLSWWGVVLTGVGILIALIAWLWPEPLKPNLNIVPTTTPLAQGMENFQAIPTKEPEEIRIVVFRFDEVSQVNYRVTDLLLVKRTWAVARIFSTSSTPNSPTEKAPSGLAKTSTAPNSRAWRAILLPRGVRELTRITDKG